MEEKFGQKLTEEEVRAYIPNRNLQLTLSGEVKRLHKVIEEKNECIAKFKRYDEERKAYYRRFEQNYEMMEERFNEFLEVTNDCDEIDDGTKEFYKEVVMRLYQGKVNSDKDKSVFQKALSELNKLQDCLNNMEFVMMGVGNPPKRGELLNELRKVKVRYDNILSSFQKKMKEFK
jgi:GTP1/Obg family GTP-binding protein